MVFVPYLLTYFVLVSIARSILGGENEHIAFLWSQALELQGEVQKAFVHAVVYESLDPLVSSSQIQAFILNYYSTSQ